MNMHMHICTDVYVYKHTHEHPHSHLPNETWNIHSCHLIKHHTNHQVSHQTSIATPSRTKLHSISSPAFSGVTVASPNEYVFGTTQLRFSSRIVAVLRGSP
mmetsp:Transcript_5327/g.15634  ORF Transcript_5327/g.15634 Transcript_5327/m.15634 type:complete len:101 (-) Transcript_5327:1058-1360(-)